MRKFGQPRKIGLSLVTVALLCSGAVRADDSALPLDRRIGERVSNFTLRDMDDKPVSLYSFAGKKALVLVFLDKECPVVRTYIPRLNRLAKEYAEKNVLLIGVYSAASTEIADIKALLNDPEAKIEFPVYRDADSKVAHELIVVRAPEAIVLNAVGVIRYRGGIDDQYLVGKRREKPSKNYLVDALEDVLAGRPPAVNSAPVEGCILNLADSGQSAKVNGPKVRGAKRALAEVFEKLDKDASPDKMGKVTYAEHVAPIVQNKCQNCHRPGQSGPFSLLGYQDLKQKAEMIEEVVRDRRMPPWHADPSATDLKYENDRSLSPTERATMLAWVAQGAPRGDVSKEPPAKKFRDGWSIAEPGQEIHVVEIPKPNVVPAEGTVNYIRTRVPTNFKEDMWVQAAEAVPGERSVVHHIIVFVDDHSGGGRGQGIRHLCGYAPGDMPSVYPKGIAKKIPAGSDFIFELHYTPDGKVRTDRSKVGLIFAKKEDVKHEAMTVPIANNSFTIPPDDSNHEVKASRNFRQEAVLLAFMPHMHLRGKDFKYTLTQPGQAEPKVLLSVPAYDFGWQSYYKLEKPITLQPGSRIDCTAHFDNSTGNPVNPDHTKAVRWGDQTYEEMMIGYIDIYLSAMVGDKPAANPAEKRAQAAPTLPDAAVAKQALRRFIQQP